MKHNGECVKRCECPQCMERRRAIADAVIFGLAVVALIVLAIAVGRSGRGLRWIRVVAAKEAVCRG